MAHVCPYCDGSFLEKGELATLRRTPSDLAEDEVVVVRDEPPAKCPQCGVAMEIRRFTREHATVVDECLTCEGIWLDSAELKTILSDGRQG